MRSSNPILVVEDRADTRDALRFLLQAEGYRVGVAADGREALSHLRNAEPPLVILLDLNMPAMDGWQFRQQQRLDPGLAAIPVILLSADDHLPQTAAALGAAGYFHKPIPFDTLLELLGEI
jgi:CheY-like chemotaxis protein